MGPYWFYDNHYLTEKIIINPAYAGHQHFPKVFASTHRKELQLPNAPMMHVVGAHSRLGNLGSSSSSSNSTEQTARNAIGGVLFADINGPFQAIGTKLDYSYTVPLNRNKSSLSFGLGGILFSKRIRVDKFYPDAADDPLIAASIGNHVTVPDVNVGVLFTHQQFYAGFSVSQLLENSYHFSKFNYTPARVFRNFYLMTGYRFIFEIFELEPSIVAARNFASETRHNIGNFVDLNLEFYLKPIVFSLSYRYNGFISAAVLFRTEKLEMGMRAELFSTNRTDARFSSFGLMAAYTFNKF